MTVIDLLMKLSVKNLSEEGYPILRLGPKTRSVFDPRPRRSRRAPLDLKLREQAMQDDLSWPSVWPTAKTFVPSAVPLPIRQSYEEKPNAVPRGKYANTELLKIANFLHITPVAVKMHCSALRKFCTKWPENLDTDEQVRAHFPATFVTSDYCHSSPSIRDFKARQVKLKVNIDDLKLEGLDKVKLIELLDHRYNKETGMITITTQECPMKIQNQDYAEYLLSAVYYESQEHQPWESERIDEEAFSNIDLDEYRKSVEKKLGFAPVT